MSQQVATQRGETAERRVMSSPEDLHGAPQVEHHEDDGLVLHLLQAAEDDEQDDVPAGQLQRPRAE